MSCCLVYCPFPPLDKKVLPRQLLIIFSFTPGIHIGFRSLILSELANRCAFECCLLLCWNFREQDLLQYALPVLLKLTL